MKKEEDVVSNPYFVQSVSSMQMSSISQMMLGRKRACYKSLSGKDILVHQLMDYYSILYITRNPLNCRDIPREKIAALFDKVEHAYCPKDSLLVERGKPHSLYAFLLFLIVVFSYHLDSC